MERRKEEREGGREVRRKGEREGRQGENREEKEREMYKLNEPNDVIV